MKITILLLTVMLILLGIQPPVGADTVMTLVATGGTIGERQDVPFGSISGDNFGIGGLSYSFGTAMPSFPNADGSHPRPVPGQLFDQSGPFFIDAMGGVNGSCCILSGSLQIVAVPALVEPTSSQATAVVTAPFTASGILSTRRFFTFDQGPYGDYAFQGQGMMTTTFFPCTVSSGFCGWDTTTLTFTPAPAQTIIGGGTIANEIVASAIPEPATWLLLTSGLMGILLMQRRNHGVTDEPSSLPDVSLRAAG